MSEGVARDGETCEAGEFPRNASSVVSCGEIDGDVMVIAVVRKKAEGAPVGGEHEAKRFVEVLRNVEIGDGEMHVAKTSGVREFERISTNG